LLKIVQDKPKSDISFLNLFTLSPTLTPSPLKGLIRILYFLDFENKISYSKNTKNILLLDFKNSKVDVQGLNISKRATIVSFSSLIKPIPADHPLEVTTPDGII